MNKPVEMSAQVGQIPGAALALKNLPSHVASFLHKQSPTIFEGFKFIESLDTEEQFLDAVRQLQGMEQAVRILRGYIYRCYRQDNLHKRDFTEFLKAHNVSRSTAYDYIHESEVFERLCDENACLAMATALQAKQIRTLRCLDSEQLNAFVNGQEINGLTFEEAAELDAKDISATLSLSIDDAQRIQDLENKNANLETELDTAKTREEELLSRLKKERSGSEYPDFVVATRHESDALSQKALLCMDDMSRLMDDLIKLQNDEHLSSEFENHLNMSSTTLLIHLNGMQAKLSQILHNAMINLPPQLTSQQVNANMLYSDEEIGHAISEREMLVREHEQEKQIRANEREANKKRGPGRPKGSK
ncbi:MAG: hypothetical protein ACRBB4_01505 [Neptuniibacter sp.]